MPAQFTRKLTDEQKAEIALTKKLRPTSTSTNKNIAQAFDVSTDLIARVSYQSLTPAQKEIYDRKQADLKYHAQDLTFNAIIRAKDMLHDSTTRLSEVMGAAKIGNDIYRLETNQPTQITQDNSPERLALEFVKAMIADGYNQALAIEELRRFHDLAPVDIREKVVADIAANPKLLTEGKE